MSSWMGVVALIRNHNSVPHMVVHEVNPEVGPVQCPSPTPINWEHQRSRSLWEGDVVGLGLRMGGGKDIEQDQSTDSLREPPYVGHYCDSG